MSQIMKPDDVNENNTLPNYAYHPSHEEFSRPPIENDDYTPKAVSSIEQLMRVAIGVGGRDNAVHLTEKAIEYQKNYEEENVFADFSLDRSRIEQSNDVWLQTKLHELADEYQQVLNNEEKLFEKREHWYDDDIIPRLEDKLQRGASMLRSHQGTVEFTALTVVDSVNHDFEHEHVVHKNDLSGADISGFDLETPINLVVCTSPNSGNMYPFIPWFGTTVCACPSKQENPVSTLCKHETAALLEFSRDDYEPTGVDLPQRFKRLVAPQEYQRFRENITV